MRSLLQERCEIEFVRYVAGILAIKPDCLGQATADTPWGPWGFMQAGIPHLIRDIRAAQDAKVWFSEHGPPWGQPLPMGRECSDLFRARGPLYLLGAYAFSLQMLNFDFRAHPSFHDYGCGVMFNPHAPNHVRDDPELQAEFPARELPGLCGRLVWFNPTERTVAA